MQTTIQFIQQLLKILMAYIAISFSAHSFATDHSDESELIFAPQPLYPIQARTHQQEGFVEVMLNFDQNGQVIDIDILSAKNRSVFEKMVLYTVSNWQLTASKLQSRVLRKRFDFSLTNSVEQQTYNANTKNSSLVTSLNSTHWDYQAYKQELEKRKASFKAYMQRKHTRPNH